MPKPTLINPELQQQIMKMLKEAPQARWFKRQDGVLFISIEDVLREFRQIQRDGLCEPRTMEILITGLEASRDIAEIEIKKYEK